MGNIIKYHIIDHFFLTQMYMQMYFLETHISEFKNSLILN